ncbi:DNA-binding protein [Natrinema salsiterrestre]|uniref:DNA-binding protein n=1 Tax=Natrinema salsiterrestre TaxID=2950540 RepID=A0A9Q4Q0F7_9EURY|nr:DNA-binding protein [Natrinema salsiterrestre]MDF9745874.1 DNA-binding protein [Natrinema salsiterrestre]
MRLARRVAIAAVLLTALGGLCVHYGATYDDNWPHPTGDQIQQEGLESFTGDRVLLFGEVRAVNGDAETITIHVVDDNDEVAAELEVRGVDDQVAPGGVVQVYGVLESGAVMDADRTVVVNRDPSATTYKLVTSVVGLLLAVGYFLQQWRFDVRGLAFEPRISDSELESEPETEPAEVRQRG